MIWMKEVFNDELRLNAIGEIDAIVGGCKVLATHRSDIAGYNIEN